MPPTPPDLTAANRAFFDDLAAKYDLKPWQQHLTQQITTHIQQNLAHIGIPHRDGVADDPVTLLDYACGTGAMSRALGPSVSAIRALDLSPNMVARYNELAALSEIPSVRNARAVEGDLLTATATDPAEAVAASSGAVDVNGAEFFDFDVVAVGVGLHHFDDPARAIGRLARRLRAGGVLVVVDFVDEEDGGGHGHPLLPKGAEHTVRKHGFGEGEMRGMMEMHGLGGFRWVEMLERLELRMHEERPVSRKGFLARAARVAGE